LLYVLLSLCACCQYRPMESREKPVEPRRDINFVLRAHEHELMSVSGRGRNLCWCFAPPVADIVSLLGDVRGLEPKRGPDAGGFLQLRATFEETVSGHEMTLSSDSTEEYPAVFLECTQFQMSLGVTTNTGSPTCSPGTTS